ncbi:hypothetical protein C2E23DRAFT_438954 [Lenzites betulinus]|nr:hypothetical protein C2E23DRAFT_438954 [Lenzites betulinus]
MSLIECSSIQPIPGQRDWLTSEADTSAHSTYKTPPSPIFPPHLLPSVPPLSRTPTPQPSPAPMPFTAPTSSGRRSFWSSKPRLDKKAISRPREYVWPEFVAPVPVAPVAPQFSSQEIAYQYLQRQSPSYEALGVQLISLLDAKCREGIVRGTLQHL